ncbi:hypothetical protein CPU12_11240 [Malaciobacter molluscorum LMG 25693]|uniref:Mannosyl-glycoprotein endo-beta-N-acetylglucosamidase-like domain-containing protein n=1 Tax=Malaciobacter molluscorum LMG 25693 TaxID=870501 RepID=A0A2G1DG25_9BACT|nr:glucosaminidase domain-containing protein [Malaciobacter molluscorum]AXX93570.1 hypothetical protein AMOL_2631 [Malaciobacter molluscorum LMG 25693]PHO17276.1 hypothetical protein CPU12_11240 [Malaciobacter molluscorum LMG 25693]
MKKSYLVGMSIIILFLFGYFFQLQNKQIRQLTQEVEKLNKKVELLQSSEEKLKQELEKYTKKKQIPVSVKKKRFINMMLKPLDEVYNDLKSRYLRVKKDIDENNITDEIKNLKEFYSVDSNEKLLYALKPHPKSIALAQGAMESAWGQSRFFKEANNMFGVWSFNKDEPRIAANSKRGTKTIWLKKYSSVKDAIKDYYETLSKSPAFKAFRKQNYENPNPYILVKKLDRYSEKKALYGKELASVIKYNNFTKYDDKDFIVQKDEEKLTKEEQKEEEQLEQKAIEQAASDEVTTSDDIQKDEVVSQEQKKDETKSETTIDKKEEKKTAKEEQTK